MSISSETIKENNPYYLLKCLETFKQTAEMFGLEGNQALLSANKATTKLTGLNPMELLGISLNSKIQEQEYAVSDIAKLLSQKYNKKITAREVNQILEKEGFQETYHDHKERKRWRILEKAEKGEYGVYKDILKRHSNGAPILQIKWFHKTILYLLESNCFE